MAQLTWLMARERGEFSTILSPEFKILLKLCMQRILWNLQRQLYKFKKAEYRIVYQPEFGKSPPNYCEKCDVELFCILFVKAVPDYDENGKPLPLETYWWAWFEIIIYHGCFDFSTKPGGQIWLGIKSRTRNNPSKINLKFRIQRKMCSSNLSASSNMDCPSAARARRLGSSHRWSRRWLLFKSASSS